ncbi:hypothetical protein AB0903_33615 [Streptomyces sp. NPDC048389]|uniref:hypothetical protein n=1 Tax=Streptomyces sp. NPDC048389 TaxID=3154622 RepID=UPI0034542A42
MNTTISLGLLVFAVAVAAWFAAAVIADHWPARRPPQAVQPVRVAPQSLHAPSQWGHADARHTRPPTRHRREGRPCD